MAERLDTPFPGETRKLRTYPWDEWCDGSNWKLVRGEDYDVDTDQFRNRLYPKGKARGLEVKSTKFVEVQVNGRWETAQLGAEELLQIDGRPTREGLYVQFYGHSGV